MTPFNRPMVALSLSPSDAGLLQYANRALQLSECEQVRFVHIAADGKSGAGGANKDELREKMRAEVGEQCPHARDRAAYDVAQGPRLDRLLELATEHKSDVIMLGHRRARSGRRSLARRLAMIAPCSVWLVPEGSAARLGRILTPIDFSTASGDALSLATRIAAAHASEMCLALHVYFDESAVQYDEHILEIQGNEQAAFNKLLKSIDRQGVEITPVFEESPHPPEAILRVAREHDVELLVMATRGRSLASAILLGSTTSATMATTPIPMLAVKHFGSQLSIVGALLDRNWGKSPKTN